MAAMLPLIVELDGAVISSALDWEQRIVSVRHSSQKITYLGTNNQLQQPAINIDTLPYCESVLSLLREEYHKGRSIILLVNGNYPVALQLAEYLQCFTKVEDISHYSQQQLQEYMLSEFGDKGFDFVGHSDRYMLLCGFAQQSYIVNPSKRALGYISNLTHIKIIDQQDSSKIKDWLYELRLHQWVKNLLIFIPLLTSHQLSLNTVFYGLIAFLLFGLCSSSAYVLNDLLDLADDRTHKTKKYRPFAAGRLAIKQGLIISPLLIVISLLAAIILLPSHFVVVLLSYYVLTLLYSLIFKRYMAIDVVILAMLYTLRIIAGGVALNITLTSWILAFAIFIFLSLALVKRYTELNDALQADKNAKIKGRGYYPDDLSMIASLGAAAGYLSVMVLALYINSPQVAKLYTNTEIIWLACPILLFWVTRIWLLAHRGELHSDPVVFAIKDKVSLLAGGLFILVFWIAL